MRTLLIVARVFALVGLAFLLTAGTLTYLQTSGRSGWTSTTGQVVSHDFDGDNYRPVVRFTTGDGRQVDVRGRVWSNLRPDAVGTSLPVDYDPARPEDARIATTMERWFLPGIFGLLGGVFAIIGVGLLIFTGIARKRDERLRRTGERYLANVVGVSRNGFVKYNEQAAWRIDASWRDPLTGEDRTAKSRNLDFDPAPWLKPQIDVYIDRGDRKRALVDVAEIEAAAGR